MRLSEITIQKDGQRKYDFHWDDARGGFTVTVGDEEKDFFKAKDPKWDRSGAQELARKAMVKLRSDAVIKQQKEDEYRYQYEKPLSELEQKWAELTNRFMDLTDAELKRWTNLLPVVRKSLIDGTHQALIKK